MDEASVADAIANFHPSRSLLDEACYTCLQLYTITLQTAAELWFLIALGKRTRIFVTPRRAAHLAVAGPHIKSPDPSELRRVCRLP